MFKMRRLPCIFWSCNLCQESGAVTPTQADCSVVVQLDDINCESLPTMRTEYAQDHDNRLPAHLRDNYKRKNK